MRLGEDQCYRDMLRLVMRPGGEEARGTVSEIPDDDGQM